jgi:hypothetical protein
MQETKSALFEQEWITLQNAYEQYEKYALIIKLTAVALSFAGLSMHMEFALLCPVVMVLWIQEGVWKTYQSRIGERLLIVESAIKNTGATDTPFQLHTDWQAGKAGVLGLVREYLSNSLRPTVVYPYGILIAMYWMLGLL